MIIFDVPIVFTPLFNIAVLNFSLVFWRKLLLATDVDDIPKSDSWTSFVKGYKY